MRSKSFYLLLALLYCTQSFAQSSYTLKGIVKDATSGEPLPFATVFFAGTTYGTTSKDDASYELVVKSAGTYDLIVKFVGYRTFVAQVTLGEAEIAELDILISPSTKDLGSVVVVAKKDKKWKSYLKEFKILFLGNSMNAKECKIVNEYVLDFAFDKENSRLEGFANKPVIVENMALGYRIKYYLEDFFINYETNLSGYNGYTIFEEIEPKNDRKKRNWNTRRTKAYYGSPTHFFASLAQDRLLSEGYKVGVANLVDGELTIYKDSLFKDEILDKVLLGDPKTLSFTDYLVISFKNEFESQQYILSQSAKSSRVRASPRFLPRNPQKSWVRLTNENVGIKFESNGYVLNPTAYISSGYWGFELLADKVPLDYMPND